MQELVDRYFEEKESEGCWGGRADYEVKRAVYEFAEWAEQSRPTPTEADSASSAEEYCPGCDWLVGYCECAQEPAERA